MKTLVQCLTITLFCGQLAAATLAPLDQRFAWDVPFMNFSLSHPVLTVPSGITPTVVSASANSDGTMDAELQFGSYGYLVGNFSYEYSYDADSDVTIWQFDFTNLVPGESTPLNSISGLPPGFSVPSGYTFTYLGFDFGSCLAYCDDNYPDLHPAPIPAAGWLFLSALGALAGRKVMQG